MTSWPLFWLNAWHSDCLMGCQVWGATVLRMCTSTPSKIARANTWRGMEMASSSTLMAGYLEFLIGWIICTGAMQLYTPGHRRSSVCTSEWNMKSSHIFHHLSTLPMFASNMLITLGRMKMRPSLLMVLVMRSGIEISRLLPMALSLRNSLTASRCLYSVFQRCSHSSRPAKSHALASNSARSSATISSEMMLQTSKSLFSGLSMKTWTSCMSLAYSRLWWVIQYSKGLLLTAAMFHVTTRRFIGSWLSNPGSSGR
mmetsp:Transcript_29814/g.70860  ORF Transcript_29814/g.70860 Transcript_29814/m.70860 type:complete len:256 (-) Transcript_29814:475-1242(-)